MEAGGAASDTPAPSVQTLHSAPGLDRHGQADGGEHDGPHVAPNHGRRRLHHRDEPDDLHPKRDLRRHEQRHPDEPGGLVLAPA